jgi:hypothetical protein
LNLGGSDGADPGVPDDEPDPRVSTVPLETEDGRQVIIQQQNTGPGNQVGAGEFKPSRETSVEKDPGEAADEQERLEQQAPVPDDGSGAAG